MSEGDGDKVYEIAQKEIEFQKKIRGGSVESSIEDMAIRIANNAYQLGLATVHSQERRRRVFEQVAFIELQINKTPFVSSNENLLHNIRNRAELILSESERFASKEK
jgi:hypothetical protein